MEHISSYLLAFLITSLLILALQPVARFFGIVDQPGGRKKHEGAIPLVGGIAIYIGIIIGVAALNFPFGDIKGLLVGGGLLLIVGTIDDVFNLSATARFITQITAALIMISIGHVDLTDLGHLLSDETLSLNEWSLIFTVFATVGVINAMNMSDGMDGLAGGVAVVTFSALAVFAATFHQDTTLTILIIVIAAILGFLKYNMRAPWLAKAKIFMGNGGSMFLGFTVAWFLISLAQGPQRVISPVIALWLFAVPLLDTVCVMLRRVIKGRSPFAPDREHFHHILLVAGYTVNQTVWIIIGVASVFAAIGIVGHLAGVEERTMLTGILLVFAIYFWGMSHAWKVMKVIRREKKAASETSNPSTHS